MASIDRCTDQIASVRQVASGIDPAYVARSRIGRLVLSVVTLVAEEANLSSPNLPGPIRVPSGVSLPISELAASCNRLVEITRHLSQPSEPLDARWRRGWTQLIEELDTLKTAISRLRA